MNQYQIKTPDIAGSYLKGKEQRRKEEDYQQDKTQKAKALRMKVFKYAYEKMYEPQGKKLIEEGDQAGATALTEDMKSKYGDIVDEVFGENLSFDVKAKTGTSTVIVDSAEDLGYMRDQGLVPDSDYNFNSGKIERGEPIKLRITRNINNNEITKIEDLYEGGGKNKIQTFNQRINNAEGLADMINEKKDTLDSRLSDISPLDAQANTASILNRGFNDYRYEFDSMKDFRKSTKKKSLQTQYPVYIEGIEYPVFSTEEEAEASGVKGNAIINGRKVRID